VKKDLAAWKEKKKLSLPVPRLQGLLREKKKLIVPVPRLQLPCYKYSS
jgi:hypothetical protein